MHAHTGAQTKTCTHTQGLRPKYEAHHGVVITDAALEAAVRCAKRYVPDRKLPDRYAVSCGQ